VKKNEWNSFASKTPWNDLIILVDSNHTRRTISYGYFTPSPEEEFNTEPWNEGLDELRADGYVYWKYAQEEQPKPPALASGGLSG